MALLLFLAGCDEEARRGAGVQLQERPAYTGIPCPKIEGWKIHMCTSFVPVRMTRDFNGQSAEITVITKALERNEWDKNVARWGREIGIDADASMSKQKTTKIFVDDIACSRIHLENNTSENGEAIVGVLLPERTRNWFIRLKGTISAVNNTENDFQTFLDEFQSPDKNQKIYGAKQ